MPPVPRINGKEQFTNVEKSRSLALKEWKAEADTSDLGDVQYDHKGVPVKLGAYPLLVGGRLVKPKQIRAFNDWRSGSYTDQQLADKNGVEINTVKFWKMQEWWKAWAALWFTRANEDLQGAIVARDDKLVNAYDNILTGLVVEPKIANAQVQAMKLRMEMGADPVVNRRPVHTTINAIQSNTLITTPERIAELARHDPSKIREWMATGNKPSELTAEHITAEVHHAGQANEDAQQADGDARFQDGAEAEHAPEPAEGAGEGG